jgi:hypothetical protein
MIKGNVFGSKYVNVPANNISSFDAHLAEGQFLLEQILNKGQSLMYREGTRKSINFQNRRTEFRTKVNLNKEQCIKMLPPHTQCVQF